MKYQLIAAAVAALSLIGATGASAQFIQRGYGYAPYGYGYSPYGYGYRYSPYQFGQCYNDEGYGRFTPCDGGN